MGDPWVQNTTAEMAFCSNLSSPSAEKQADLKITVAPLLRQSIFFVITSTSSFLLHNVRPLELFNSDLPHVLS